MISATFQLSSAASLNLGQIQNGLIWVNSAIISLKELVQESRDRIYPSIIPDESNLSFVHFYFN